MTTEQQAPETLFIDGDGDVCITGRANNLVFCPAVDDDGRVQHPDVIARIVSMWNTPSSDQSATIERLTAERDRWRNDCLDANQSELELRRRAEKAEAERDAALAAGFAQGIEAAAERIDREISNRQAQLSREGSALSDLKRPSVKYAIRRADLDARMSCRDAISALAGEQP